MRRVALVALTLVSCRTFGPVETPPRIEAPMDEACLARARAGQLLSTLPPRVGAFTLTVTSPRTFTLHRPGRPISDEAGSAMWQAVGANGPVPGMMMGHSATGSVFTCPGVADGGCLTLQVSVCTPGALDRLTRAVEVAASTANVPDGEVLVQVTANEADGPSCKDGPRCRPTAHYSTADAVYRATRFRVALPDWSSGRCVDDGDCDNAGNGCRAWYQRGGAELSLYVERNQPTFCGCVERRCVWFTQE